MEEYPSASRRAQPPKEKAAEDPKKVEKIVTGEVTVRKKSLGKRFKETFIGSDDARGVGAYLLYDVAVPALKDTITDVVTQGIERMLFGEVRSRGRGRSLGSAGPSGYVSYNRIASGSPVRPEPRRDISRRGRANFDFGEIYIDTRTEAMEVIENMHEMLSKFGSVSVADLYGLVGIAIDFTDRNWGWYDLRGAQAVRLRNQYLLDLPQPEPIE